MLSIFLLVVAVFIPRGIVIEGKSPTVSVNGNNCANIPPELPYFLGGTPQHEEEHDYFEEHAPKHTADGKGLSRATAGEAASFTIRVAKKDVEGPAAGSWNVDDGTFFYVWIASEEHIFTAEVVNNGNGTLVATYESAFPGQYLVYVEAVVVSNHNEGVPIEGSPFSLTISGNPAVDIDALPTCEIGDANDENFFWNTGTWASSNIASAEHGVTRDGWVFQPKTCAYDTFSYDDLMLLASLSEPTWLLVLGGSVQRGLFLMMVDMVLAQGQKDDFGINSIQKCWGYADITLGNLRVTYQDMRLWTVGSEDESMECNNEKLVSGSSTAYIRSAKDFLQLNVFQHGHPMPTVITAASFLRSGGDSPNMAVEVLMDALPSTWNGTLLMLQHMSGLGTHWQFSNPTRTAWQDVGIERHDSTPLDGAGLRKMKSYREQDPRMVFMSTFPMYQAKLFENQRTRDGKRRYGGSQHYHYVVPSSESVAYNGSKMVHSSILEMLSHIVFATAVGGKAAFFEKVAATPDIGHQTSAVRRTFELCTDCPGGLLPFHVKPLPEPVCETVTSLPANALTGKVWNNELCPDWCMATEPVDLTPTESGLVDVRICDLKDGE